ncbi:hypothetical protein BDQ12DRAFT_691478 [Crucibulum laeve]|uniref:PIN domain-like protein n=1 Tax=Crucibulum laeve TaxID=68775 RepID=A0A5C3LKS4_9AGAR|nr:hypothetical protein BDQ12DRAFT_691478 [Crucibulum laeve]
MGVKSLWSLLTPVGRPILLETCEGKAMAIDSSIWIYQFQATMRDKEGHSLSNAHVLGFLRRIAKLLFYGIKPVFVFDGGAPTLKRSTLNERKKKKSGAAASHAKIAEKLLAAQMRREALNHVRYEQLSSKTSKRKRKVPVGAVVPNENTVYLEDIDSSMPKTPARKKPVTPTSSSTKKNKFHDHDPYKLPEVDLEEAVAKATRAAVPDPRLATEEELRAFIEDMRPEDFDVNSPAFRELPTEVKYEIVGDLRLKSRQTSYARLQNMLKSSRTPLDFSKQQIQNLRQRNSLTQQLLMTTDNIGNAHIAIPIRIASERNRQYILMKNEGESGGWILGIRDDTGKTQDKPIEIDQDSDKGAAEDEDSDADMEEVEVPPVIGMDADLREHRRGMALSAIAGRDTSKKLAPLRTKKMLTKPIYRKQRQNPLFHDLEEDELPVGATMDNSNEWEDEDDDDILAFAIQESLDQSKESSSSQRPSLKPKSHDLSAAKRTQQTEYDFLSTPMRLETALSIANAGPSRTQASRPGVSSLFGQPTLLSAAASKPPVVVSDLDDDMEEEVPPVEDIADSAPGPLASTTAIGESMGLSDSDSDSDMEPIPLEPLVPLQAPIPIEVTPSVDEIIASSFDEPVSQPLPSPKVIAPISPIDVDSPLETTAMGAEANTIRIQDTDVAHQPSPKALTPIQRSPSPPIPTTTTRNIIPVRPLTPELQPEAGPSRLPQSLPSPPQLDPDEEALFAWSRSPSPTVGIFDDEPAPNLSDRAEKEHENWDAANEMDAHAEEGEFARFMSQVKGKDLNDVRKEIDEEIKTLNDQRKAAMRDSEDITQQMISQIMTMLRLFGIPYITAPMEAEAQCAELVSLELVDGVITDDSDVFLFGATRVFKNMFNQSKTVECFLLSELSRELGLDRDTLIRLAYLLGSDYVEGLPGVGPVVAMELLKEFPGKDGLHKFKDWWTKVQSGKDKDEDNKSTFRKRFKKKFKNLYLPPEWPNTAVKDAYYHPTVDSSDEPFKWGLPDLDGLRDFFRAELDWGKNKVDELLLPIIQRMNKRGQASALNKQGNLNEYFDVTAGSGTFAPRKRQAYTSKRLQQVVSDFRKRRKSSSAEGTPAPAQGSGSGSGSGSEVEGAPPPTKRKKTAAAVASTTTTTTTGVAKGKGRARTATASSSKATRGGKKATALRKRKKRGASEEDSEDADEFAQGSGVDIEVPLMAELRPRPKPRPAYKGAEKAAAQQTSEEQQAEAIQDEQNRSSE